ncbi:MAG: tRNA guanosine(34) transglycosylase Tgt [Sedimentisphaerales bacterium]|nr:tRNA guanosine(34) transglycosylase Tgt [Sedimentisphaerales bacterium]
MVGYSIIKTDDKTSARLGVLKTAHGDVETPVFMPVGTSGAVKGITPEQLKAAGAKMILANTYHLILRPGIETVEKIGGLHKLMSWQGAILTDSGGYQVFSLAQLVRVDDNGVEFASHIDGQKMYLDAETATEIQMRLGADIIMCLDECTPYPCESGKLHKAVDRTIAWANRCKAAYNKTITSDERRATSDPDVHRGMLFGIVQGGIELEMREYCAKELVQIGFDGYAIGGLSVGEGHSNMIRTVEYTAPLLDADKPRYLMGVGTPCDIIAAVKAGIDMFDCVMPTRHGRNAYAFTDDGPVRMRNSSHINDSKPIEEDCNCYCCQNFSRAAVRHFFNVNEMLGPILVSVHNTRFYQRLMGQIRSRIDNGDFADWADEKIEKYKVFNVNNP